MRAVVQRVVKASVTIDNEVFSSIDRGLLVLLGLSKSDVEYDFNYICEKIINLRIFPDTDGNLNLSVLDIKGDILVVSQFTIMGDCRKGRRPSFTLASPPLEAANQYQSFIEKLKSMYQYKVESGKFQAMMNVELINQGPVTVLLDSTKSF